MFAQRVAAFCLLSLTAGTSWGDSREAPASPLVVYLPADSGQSPHVMEYVKREVGQLMQNRGV